MRVTVAFTLIGGKGWTGGYNYLLNLLRTLDAEAADQVRTVLFVGADVPDDQLAPFLEIAHCKCIRTAALSTERRSRTAMEALLAGRSRAISELLSVHGVDVLFEASVYFGWRLLQPALAWIPDLQHKELPHLFPRRELWKREIGYRLQMATGRTIMLSSDDSLRRFSGHYPKYGKSAHVVRFAVTPPEVCSDQDMRDATTRHGLPDHFFFMPNQYWKHKNHSLVIEALALMKSRGSNITVFASGSHIDPRTPRHIDDLRAAVRDADLADQFLMPGLIPRRDLTALMHACAAVINPSLFEGWSTTVEEARAIGASMLLSDIPVHREQAGTDATYFDPRSASSLAEALMAFRPLSQEQKATRRRLAREHAIRRVRTFADDFTRLAKQLSGRG